MHHVEPLKLKRM